MTWERVALRDLGRWFGGATPSKGNPAFWTNGTIPWLSPKDMGSEVLPGTQDFITAEAIAGSSVRLVPANSVAVVVRSGILERTLPVALVPFETTLNQDMKAVVPREDIDPRWIAWGLRAFERDLLRTTRKAGTTVASIEMPRFNLFEFPVPPVAEQRRIVEILEDHLSRLDAAERQLASAAARVAALRRGLLEAAVAPVRGSDAKPIAEATTGARSDITIGPFGSNLTRKDYRTSGVPLVFVRHVRSGDFRSGVHYVAPSKALELVAHEALDGDVCMTKMGDPPGDTAVYRGPPAVITADVLRLRVSAQHEPEYVAMALAGQHSHRQVLSITRGVAQKKVSLARFRSSVTIHLPSIDEQRIRVATFRGYAEALDRQLTVIRAAQTRGAALRRGVLAAAFEGKLTGRHTDAEVIEAAVAEPHGEGT